VSAELKRLGRYDLIRPIATGGMAEIYLAAARGREGCDKLVVIKRMLPKLATHAEHVTMFLDEARISSQLSHSNIVHFYELEARDGEYFIVMELLRGGDVLQLLRAAIEGARPFPLDVALVIGLGVCSALHYAHEKIGADGQPLHIVHRDVSPANVFVTVGGSVKLLDFGVAHAEGRDWKTRFGVIKGKLSYVSPEQARGESVDRRSDIFSLSILLWELTTLRKLFSGRDDYAVLQSIIERDVTPPSAIRRDYPRELERIVMKGLSRDPQDRYQTAQELQIDLEQFAVDHKVSTSPRSAANLVRQLLGVSAAEPTSPGTAVQYIVDAGLPAGVQRIRDVVVNELERFTKADRHRLCLALAALLGSDAVAVLLPILERSGWGMSSTECSRIAAAAALGETRSPEARSALLRVASATLTGKALRSACNASLRAHDIANAETRTFEDSPPAAGDTMKTAVTISSIESVPTLDTDTIDTVDYVEAVEPAESRRQTLELAPVSHMLTDLDALLADYLKDTEH
jgi:hypothetical protein